MPIADLPLSWGALSLIMLMGIWIIYFSLVQIRFGGPKNSLTKKYLSWEKNFGLKKFSEFFFYKKGLYFESEKILGATNFECEKILGDKKI